MKSLFLLIFFLLNFLLFAVEFVPDGDFEQVSCPDFRAFGNLVSIVETSYGRSLLLGKYSGINDVKHLSGQELPLKLKSRRDGRPYYSFQLKLNPETNYDLRFDYMPLQSPRQYPRAKRNAIGSMRSSLQESIPSCSSRQPFRRAAVHHSDDPPSRTA